MGEVPAEQLPAELVGLYGQRVLLQALRDPAEAAVASDLVQKLDRGHWRLPRGTAELYRDELAAPRPASWQTANTSILPFDWSADGRWIAALVKRVDRIAQIVLVEPDSGRLTVLQSVDWSGVGGLRFSPDSRWLAAREIRPELAYVASHACLPMAHSSSPAVPIREVAAAS